MQLPMSCPKCRIEKLVDFLSAKERGTPWSHIAVRIPPAPFPPPIDIDVGVLRARGRNPSEDVDRRRRRPPRNIAISGEARACYSE